MDTVSKMRIRAGGRRIASVWKQTITLPYAWFEEGFTLSESQRYCGPAALWELRDPLGKKGSDEVVDVALLDERKRNMMQYCKRPFSSPRIICQFRLPD